MSQTALQYDPNFLYVKDGIRPETQTAVQNAVTVAIDKVEKNLVAAQYGFVEVLKEKSFVEKVDDVFSKIRWTKTLVVVGIGGSDLGGRAIQQALEVDQPPMRVIFHGDSTDPIQIQRLLRQIDFSQTVFNIISKSGETVETISQYVFFKALLKKQTSDWQKHFVFTTDEKSGILRDEADKENILTLPIPPSVGGRFSALTPVGLLPAKAMGVEIEKLIEGALDFAQDQNARKFAQDFAMHQFELYSQNTKVAVMIPYSVQLEEFARWFRQLWAESLGKDGKGILPIQARGPADQHSQLQFYNQGSFLQSLLFVRVESRSEEVLIRGVDIPAVQYLENHSFNELINTEQEATALSLKKVGRPSATLKIEKIDELSLGQMFMFFELAVVYLGEMLGINAFDQPGVEESKQMLYALLGRVGFEEKKKEIEDLRKT